jgi:hypothetical protein
MKHKFIRYSAAVLLTALVTLTSSRAHAQEREKPIELLSLPYGIASGQTVRTSIGFDPVFTGGVFVAARIQVLDVEGEVIAQSDEIRIEAGKIRFWDLSREQIQAAGDSGTGRLQVRTRILITTSSFDANRNRPPLAPTVELYNPYVTVDFIER